MTEFRPLLSEWSRQTIGHVGWKRPDKDTEAHKIVLRWLRDLVKEVKTGNSDKDICDTGIYDKVVRIGEEVFRVTVASTFYANSRGRHTAMLFSLVESEKNVYVLYQAGIGRFDQRTWTCNHAADPFCEKVIHWNDEAEEWEVYCVKWVSPNNR